MLIPQQAVIMSHIPVLFFCSPIQLKIASHLFHLLFFFPFFLAAVLSSSGMSLICLKFQKVKMFPRYIRVTVTLTNTVLG